MTEFSANKNPSTQRPLVVDLDGTLIYTDMLWESAFQFLKAKPWAVFSLLLWLLRGKAALKQGLATSVEIDVRSLPYDEALIADLRAEKANGRRLILATGSNQKFAEQIAAHLDLFDTVLASCDQHNLISQKKQQALIAMFGEGGYDYIGNSRADIPIWASSQRALSVTRQGFRLPDQRVTEKTGTTRPLWISAFIKAIRPRQWLKNLLVFVPLLAGHVLTFSALTQSLLAFVAFSLAASSAYLLNDALDVADDRRHPEKRHRPIAAGSLPLPHAVVMCGALLLASLGIASVVSAGFVLVLLAYLVATVAYSIYLKRLLMVDVIMLAFLYSIRVFGGGVSSGIELSFWLLSFSFFIFLSLALLKRHSELYNLSRAGKEKARGRGYTTHDRIPVGVMGINAGFVAMLIFMLYFNSENVLRLYSHPQYLLGIVPLIVLWLGRLWVLGFRGEVNEDPIVFVSKDKRGLLIMALALILAVSAV